MSKASKWQDLRHRLSVEKREEIRAEIEQLNKMPDSEIDYSDAPAMTDEELARMVRVSKRKPEAED